MVMGWPNDQHLKVLVYDLGGGTFDVSIIELHSGVVDVLATAGDNFLGGDDFDERLAAMIADEFDEEHHIDLREQHQAWARLLRAAEEAKIELSSAPYAEIKLEYIAKDRKGNPLHIEREVARVRIRGIDRRSAGAHDGAGAQGVGGRQAASRMRSSACCWSAAPRASRPSGS